jgi:hypothetical protein
MQLNIWATTLIAVLILGLAIFLGVTYNAKSIAQKDAVYQRARADSILACKVFSDTVLEVTTRELNVLRMRKPAVHIKIVHDTVEIPPSEDLAVLPIDTTLETADSLKREVPVSGYVSYQKSIDQFFLELYLGTIHEKETITNSNVVNNPPIIIEPTFWQKSQYAVIGAGAMAIIILILNSAR